MALQQQVQKRVVAQAAHAHGVDPNVLWAIYGAESSWGKARSSFGLTGDYPGIGTSGNFAKDANRSAEILARLHRETGSLEGALRKYSGGSYGVGHVRDLERTNALGNVPGGGAAPPSQPSGGGGGGGGLRTVVQQRMQTLTLPTPQVTPTPQVNPILSSSNIKGPRPNIIQLPPPPQQPASQTFRFPTTVAKQVQAPGGGGQASPTGGRGQIRVAPGADRPGVGTSSAVKQFVSKISGLAGKPLTIGTGTNHNQLTVNGRVSDHWSGHAADIPASGAQLTRLGQLALIAAGMPRAQALKQKGGLFNVNGHQVIFNTNEGGNHFNHLHVSAY